MADVVLQELSRSELDTKPWKYIGYKDFARFVSSDDDFFVLRRFSRLHSRTLLSLQDEVSRLEDELDVLDAKLSRREAEDVDNGSFRNDTKERRALLLKIHDALCRYDDMVLRYTRLKAQQDAPRLAVENVRTWLPNRRNPIAPEEVKFLDADDLISLAPSAKTPLRRGFEQHVLSRTRGLYGIFPTKPGAGPLDTTVQGDDSRLDMFASAAVFVAAVVMLMLPLWILASVDDIFRKLAVITVFLVVFLAVLNWAISARPFEVLAATAGYSAVLVVFLQLGDPQKR